NGTMTFSDTLSNFGQGTIDCRVLYDPKADRFIFSAMWGPYDHIHASSFHNLGTVIGFSKTNNPVNGWNLYQIPYTDFHDNSTFPYGPNGDYPLIAISDSELFV